MDSENQVLIEMPVELELRKSADGEEERYIRGYASTAELDQDGETILQNGIDFSYLKKSGFINWDHSYRTMAGAKVPVIIGFPTDVQLRDKGLWVEGKLLKATDGMSSEEMKLANYAWELGQSLAKAGNGRSLAYSIEGSVLERRGKKIVKSRANHVALTFKPVNPACTVEMFRKSLCCGKCMDHPEKSCQEVHEELDKSIPAAAPPAVAPEVTAMSTVNAQPVLRENLDNHLTSVLYGDTNCDCVYPSSGRFRQGVTGAVDHMCKCLGHSKQDSINYVRSLIHGAKTPEVQKLIKAAGLI